MPQATPQIPRFQSPVKGGVFYVVRRVYETYWVHEMDFSKIGCLSHYRLHYREVLHYWLILLHFREVLLYREFITLLEQSIIIDVFEDIPLVFMAAF